MSSPCSPPPSFSHLLPPPQISSLTLSWLHEDTPSFDPAGFLIGTPPTTAHLYLKSPATLAGRPFVDAVFSHLNCIVSWQPNSEDGITHAPTSKMLLAVIKGPARNLLLGERAALNAYAECSAVATLAKQCVNIAQNAGWKGRLAGTRKTTPGFRLVQKYAMIVGGMDPHRMDLSGMVMLKDNHIKVAGGITTAIEKVKNVAGFSVKIDVECSNVEEALEAAEGGAHVVMLDNFSSDQFKKGAREVKEKFPAVLVEGSGGIGKEALEEWFCEHADVLSFSVNRYITSVDMSMKVVDVGKE